MAAVIEMTSEVEIVSTEAVGYILLNCIAVIREECNTIESVTISANNKETNKSADD